MASIYRVGSKWRAQVRLKDKPAQSQVFDTQQEAKKWARSIEGSLHKKNSQDDLLVYSEVHEKYFASLAHCGDTKKKICDALNKYWGKHRLGEITTAAITEYALKRQETGVTPSTILSDLVYFGVVLKHGGVLINNEEALRARLRLSSAVTTLRNLKVVASSKQRTRRPTEKELLKLEQHFFYRKLSQVPMWDLVLFAIATCMRLGEIVGPGGIIWEDFNESERLLRIRNRKSPEDPDGFTQIIPLLKGHVTIAGNTVDPVEIMLRQKTARERNPQARVFPFAEGTVTQAFAKACNTLEIPDLTFHDLRHDGISRMFVPGGFSIPEVAAVSGHKSWKNLQRYTQINPAELHK